MIRSALRRLNAHSETTAMVGDRMDTDVVAGLEAGLHTVLVLSGVSDAGAADTILTSLTGRHLGGGARRRTREEPELSRGAPPLCAWTSRCCANR